MAIENNLPVILDTATQTEDGLMSYQDKIKLDGMEEKINDKLGKSDKITSSQLDISSDDAKIQPENLSDEVKKMMTGTTSISATVPNNGVTTEKIANNAVTIDKIDKRFLLGNVVSPRPINFAFDDKKVSINIPKGSLLMLDAVSKRDLVANSNTQDVVVNLNYPSEFEGLNYIVSTPTGIMNIVNHTKSNTIPSTNSIVALVYLTATFEAAVVMHGSYTINGLAQGIGTESSALMGTGKIVFDQLTGIIDFTEAPILHLITGGVFNRIIENQSSIRLTDYSDDVIYTLYWNHATQALETGLANITNTDTDIAKIALIKDGRIVPFVNTGIFYSKPYIEAPYYTESFEHINNITISSKEKINILNKESNKLQIPKDAYVCVNQNELLIKNNECYYEDRVGLHYILFDLDDQIISCRFYKDSVDSEVKNIVVGTMWVSENDVTISGNFEYTIDGKTRYEDDLNDIDSSVNMLKDITYNNIEDNKILAGNELYMINGEELPIYESSMMVKSVEGIKPAISYNKNSDSMNPRTTFFNGDITIDETVKDDISLLAYAKYNKQSYLKKDVKINRVDSDAKIDRELQILCLGDNLINDKVAYYVKNKLTSLGVKPEMVGTMINSDVYGEGRDGWFYSTFVGASGRGQKEGKIEPQTAKGTSSILLNPFIRIANADDKATYPNDCYRAEGAYVEKNYSNDPDPNGKFYIYDFANYLEVQGIETPYAVIIAIKPEIVNVFTEDIVSTNMKYLRQLVNGIRKALPTTNIALIPQYGACTYYDEMWEVTSKMITETVAYVEGLKDDKVKVLSSWMHMNREFGTKYDNDSDNTQLYKENNASHLYTKLSENAKIELANSIAAFIMNI